MSDDPVLRPGNPIGPALLAIGKDLLNADALDPEKSEAAAIHGFRRRMKRWRAFLRLLEPIVGDEATRLRIEARDLARTLAGARDAQAALDAVADIGGDYEALSPASLAALRSKIEEIRTNAEALTLNDTARDMLRAALSQTADAIEHWPLDDIDFHDISAGLAENYRRARRSVPADWSVASPEELHTLRQRVVAHGYQVDLISPLWPRQSRIWIGETQRLRERLGKHQDLVVLSGLTAPKQLLARWRSKLAPVIAARQRDHIEAAMRHAGRLFAEKPQAFRDRIEAMWNAAK
jgi:CHAD domain-containing protein